MIETLETRGASGEDKQFYDYFLGLAHATVVPFALVHKFSIEIGT